jgi:ethanolamine utilization protein EutA (predicted chaperonin)
VSNAITSLLVEGISKDGLELAELHFVDVGEVIRPANVVPVVVKSLIFPESVVESPG